MWILRQFLNKSNFIAREIQIVKESIFDKRTPFLSRIFLIVAGVYLLLPFDFISDLIPILGQIDDIILVPLLLVISYTIVPQSLLADFKLKIEKEKN